MKAIKATGSAGKAYGHVPGHQYHDVDVTITRSRRGKWVVEILETWGSAQGYDEEHGRKKVIGRADNLDAALSDARERAQKACIDNDGMGYLEQAISSAEDEAAKEAEAADFDNAVDIDSLTTEQLEAALAKRKRLESEPTGLPFAGYSVRISSDPEGYGDNVTKEQADEIAKRFARMIEEKFAGITVRVEYVMGASNGADGPDSRICDEIERWMRENWTAAL